MRSENKYFYEMLLVTFSSKKVLSEELKLRYKQILNNNEAEMWDDFEKKIDMLVEEISCYIEMVDDLDAVESLWQKNRLNQESLKQKIIELKNSPSRTVGFFNKKPKSEKIEDYEREIKETEELHLAYSVLLNILPQVILNNETEIIKERKKVRFNDAMKTLSERKIKSLEDCLQFWNCVREDLENPGIIESHITDSHL